MVSGIENTVGSAFLPVSIFSTQSIFQQLRSIPELRMKLTKLSQANTTHSQYAAAMENLKHITDIGDTVEKTHGFIIEGKLLHAHKCDFIYIMNSCILMIIVLFQEHNGLGASPRRPDVRSA